MKYYGIEYYSDELQAYVMQPYIFSDRNIGVAEKMIVSNPRHHGRIIELHLYQEHSQD